MSAREYGARCCLCTAVLPGRDHEVCLPCVEANGWNPSKFGYLPSRRLTSQPLKPSRKAKP